MLMINGCADEYLDGLPKWAKKKNSLTDIRRFLGSMGDPDDQMNVIHVAGTNGKGSVCAYLTSVLLTAGYTTGTFISPHLIETRERFLYNGEMVDQSSYEESFLRVRDSSRFMMEQGLAHPTYFEFLFYMAMDMFQERKPDFVILETGLGGRLDITNVVRHPLVTVITSISLDHMEYLGDTIPKIAAEKAGIVKYRVPVVYDANEPQARAVIEERAAELKAPCYPVDQSGYEIMEYQSGRAVCRLKKMDGDFLKADIPSEAEYQVMNALVAARTVEVLNQTPALGPGAAISDSTLCAGLAAMRWPARMEEVKPGFYLDGAHNLDGIRQFLLTASRICREQKKRAWLLFSAVSDKEHGRMVEELKEKLPLDGVILTRLKSERGCTPGTLAEEFGHFKDCRILVFETTEKAVRELLKQQDENHLLFCAGSLYLMGEIKEILRRNEG